MRLIDADALIMALRLEYPMIPMFKESRKEWEEKTEGYRKAEEIINDAPTIDAVEVVRGEWIEYRPPTEDYCGMVECPFCGEELVGEPTDFNFCPNCGAKMKGADDE